MDSLPEGLRAIIWIAGVICMLGGVAWVTKVLNHKDKG